MVLDVLSILLHSITINPQSVSPNFTPHFKGSKSDEESLLAINSLHFLSWKGVTCSRKHLRPVALDVRSSNMARILSPFIGGVPTGGILAKTSDVSIVGKGKLYYSVQRLKLPRLPEQHMSRSSYMILIFFITYVSSLIFLTLLAIGIYNVCSRKSKFYPLETQIINPLLEVSYHMLHLATNGFSVSNLIGAGGFGSVYKGILHQDKKEMAVAIKVMNLEKHGASNSFVAECKALRNIRHRNVVKIITVCSSIDAQRRDFKALVYEFMPRGSLEDFLHSPSGVDLSLYQRLSVAIDIASALEYLLVECANPVIHCDLKPSNILLDGDMVAHIGDFGLATVLPGSLTSNYTEHTSPAQVKGTVGYVAPEYGIGSKVSPQGDIYSLGIIILELVTSKKPTDSIFHSGLNLHEFAKAKLPNRVMEIIDPNMLGDDKGLREIISNDVRKMECIKSIVTVGVQCSMGLPQERMNIKDVVNKLKSSMHNIRAIRI